MIWLFSIFFFFTRTSAEIEIHNNRNLSEMAIALSEISRGLGTSGTIAILNMDNGKSTEINEFIMEIHRLHLQTCIFGDTKNFFKFVESNLKGSTEVTALIFHNPLSLVAEIHRRNLAHRLSLYVFFWNAKKLPKSLEKLNLKEPLRVAMITNPRKFVYRIYYNQASSSNDGELKLVNWFDGNDLGLKTEPIISQFRSIYENFNERTFVVPVVHSPPWIFISYIDNNSNSTGAFIDPSQMLINDSDVWFDVSGRDDSLLKILARKMNFKFKYVDIQSLYTSDNASQPGELGLQMLQRREADILFGDIVATYEKMQEVEFSFFTLPDSGGFLTHAPHRLSEALALIYPFQMEVWPFLIFTVVVVGPILYILIAVLEKIEEKRLREPEHLGTFHDIIYIREMNKNWRNELTRAKRSRQLKKDGLLSRCVWFTCHIFLRQSTVFPHDNISVRLFSIILWLSATYVLSDLYSAQLTSQLARPSKELPINTLQRLEHILNKSEDYTLLVEKNSASHNVLLNGTGAMHRLYKRMEQHGASSYLLNSVEEGVQMLLERDNTVVFAGRQTLYFNMRRYGIKNFQLSEKLFTRYSAISLQKGCLFLDSLNENLMKLFEGGILDKITNDEYEKMFQSKPADTEDVAQDIGEENKDDTKNDARLGVSTKAKTSSQEELTSLNLACLQGAFYLVLIGHSLALVTLIVEIECRKAPRKFVKSLRNFIRSLLKWVLRCSARIRGLRKF